MEPFDRIQKEIEEVRKRDEEYRDQHYPTNNNNEKQKNRNNVADVGNNVANVGNNVASLGTIQAPRVPLTNGHAHHQPRIFQKNATSTKGLMQKFLKARGNLHAAVILKPKEDPRAWTAPDPSEPARVIIERGKNPRNGFIPADEKIKNEVQEFVQREAELRSQRKASQPKVMAALERVKKPETNLTNGRLYSEEDLTSVERYEPPKLRRARSLAALLDADDEDFEGRTHDLIRQFENLNQS